MSTIAFHVPAWANGPALRDIVAARRDQIEQRGFTREHDLALHPAQLPELAAQYIAEAMDVLHGTRVLLPPDPRDHLVQAAAVLWAAIDRIDASGIGERIDGGDA